MKINGRQPAQADMSSHQNTTARRIGWVESNVPSNTFSNSHVKGAELAKLG